MILHPTWRRNPQPGNFQVSNIGSNIYDHVQKCKSRLGIQILFEPFTDLSSSMAELSSKISSIAARSERLAVLFKLFRLNILKRLFCLLNVGRGLAGENRSTTKHVVSSRNPRLLNASYTTYICAPIISL